MVIIATRFIKKMYDLSIEGWMLEEELKIIEEWAKMVPDNGVVVEVGSHLGRSSYCWAKGIPESATLYCIDHWQDLIYNSIPITNRYERFLENTKDCKNIIPLKGKVPNIKYPRKLIDILYIDADHKNPNDLEIIFFFKNFLKQNALICGHDYSVEWPVVVQNVRLLEKIYKTKVKLFALNTQWEIQT